MYIDESTNDLTIKGLLENLYTYSSENLNIECI